MPRVVGSAKVEVAVDLPCELGEGCAWIAAAHELQYVDILAGQVHRYRPDLGTVVTTTFEPELSAAVAVADGGLILAIGHELRRVGPSGEPIQSWFAESHIEENRFNDCRCDPSGRLWAGTMSRRRTPDLAGLYRLVRDGPLTCELAPTTLSNGLGWSPDGSIMYFIDSTTQRIDRIDYDVATGGLSSRSAFAMIDPTDGLPDGLTVDADGGVWVALFGGGAVRRYSPDGALDQIVELPTSNPTCPSFGGDDLRTLFVTTARHRLSDRQLAEQPEAGALFAVEVGIQGLPATPFQP